MKPRLASSAASFFFISSALGCLNCDSTMTGPDPVAEVATGWAPEPAPVRRLLRGAAGAAGVSAAAAGGVASAGASGARCSPTPRAVMRLERRRRTVGSPSSATMPATTSSPMRSVSSARAISSLTRPVRSTIGGGSLSPATSSMSRREIEGIESSERYSSRSRSGRTERMTSPEKPATSPATRLAPA